MNSLSQNNKKISLIGLGIICSIVSQTAQADIEKGKEWLKTNQNSQIANQLQTLQEVKHTLAQLQTQLQQTDINTLLEQEDSTEGLVRLILLSHSQNQPANTAWQKILANQNEDGGFGHLADWQSNPLDTAYVLIALNQSNYINSLTAEQQNKWQQTIAKALHYLTTQQQTDGKYQIHALDDLYTNSYVLSAFTPYLKQYGQYIPTAQRLVNYLQNQQSANATWSKLADNKGLFLDALVAESLYPYQSSENSQTFKQNFSNRVLALQNSDGSWQQDAYVTALVLRTLDNLQKPIVNPTTSAISLTVIDAETGIGLPNVQLLTQTGSVQTIALTSDKNGHIIAQDTKAGAYQFTLQLAGYAPVSFNLNLKQGEQINLGQIKLAKVSNQETAQIQGVIKDQQTQNPLNQVMITATLVDDKGNRLPNFEPITTSTDNQGRYQITLNKEQIQASQGKFTIQAKKEGYLAVTGNGTVLSGGTAIFSPQLTAQTNVQSKVFGKVLDETGNPLQNAQIKRDGNVLATTNQAGEFSLIPDNIGKQVWEIGLTGYQSIHFNMVLEANSQYNMGTITLVKQTSADPQNPNTQPVQGQGNFHITATDSRNQKAITGFYVKAEKLDKTNQVIQTQSFSPDNDNFGKLLATLPTGKWRLTVSHKSYQPVSKTFDLTANQSIEYNPVLTLNPYQITAVVVDSLSNKPIAKAPVKVIDSQSKTVLFTGQTDDNGKININHNLTASDIEIEVTPALYLATKRYISKNYETDNHVDMGEIRLRPKSAEVILPDLAITKTNIQGISTGQQDLLVSGKLGLTIENKGNAEISQQEIAITAFVDSNRNRKLDKDEQILGKTSITQGLSPQQETQIELAVSGKLRFRDAPIAVMIDSDEQIAEKNESNNVRLTSDGVEIKPKQGTLDAEVVWQNLIESDSGAIAAPLEDTNNDGIIGQGDVASILIYSRGQYHVLNGKTGEKQFQIQGSGSQQLAGIADIDNDKLPDIIVPAIDGLRIYDNKGNLKKTLKANLSFSGWAENAYHPIIADLDQDGTPEIIQNNKIFNYEQGLIKDGLPSGQSQAVADVDGDGKQDIVGLAGVADMEGNLLYPFNNGQYDINLKFLAIGDVIGTKQPQIIAIYGSYVSIFDAKNGKILAEYNAPSYYGGSPVIADFDGDGLSDIGVARTYNYVAMRGDGSIIWNTPINDGSGGTGSTVFDFDNDGKTEAVHFDEYNLRIYDASTGVERIKIPNYTPTAHEYPIVGDFDADGHADIIITSEHNGVRMISSKNKDWANTRNIWNQYSYHVTNINDDLSVPVKEPNSWEVHNTYRANLLLNQNATSAVDLTTSYLQIIDNGIHAPTQFKARIGNAGAKVAPKGTPISFYQKDNAGQSKLLGIVRLDKDLGFDEFVDINLDYSPLTGTLKDFGEIVVIANDAGAGIESVTGIPNPTDPTTPQDNHGVIQEYSRHNNIASLSVTADFTGFSLAGVLDKNIYTANENVQITSIPTNLGSFSVTPKVKITILDEVGNTIHQFAEQSTQLGIAVLGKPLLNENSATLKNTWNTAQHRVGNYSVKIELIHQNQVVASIDRPFSIVADGAIGQTNTLLATDKTQYQATDLVQIHSRLLNTASNAMATARDISLTVADPTGQIIWTKQYNYQELSPNAIKDQYFTLPLHQATAGDYIVTSITTAPDGSQSRQTLTQTFKVLSVSETGSNLSGVISSPNQVEIGDNVNLNWQLNNPNNHDITNIPLEIALFKGDSTTAFHTISLPNGNVSAQNHVSGNQTWLSTGNHGDIVTAMLVATFNGEKKAIAQTQIKLIEAPITAIFTNKDNQKDTLLVYYSCENGWYTSLSNSGAGNFNYPCFDERANIIRSYLDRLQVNYKLVKHPWEFRHELQSGIYGNYWILGAVENLSPHTYKELVERVHTGDNLLFDAGMHSWLNHDLFKLAGVTYQGRAVITQSQMTPNTQYLPTTNDKNIDTALLNTQMQIKGQPLHSNWALTLKPNSSATQVWAIFGNNQQFLNQPVTHQRFNAITTAPYGKGYPMVMSFDLIRSLDLARTSQLPIYQNNANISQLRWDSILSQLLKDRRVKARGEYVPREPVKIPITLNNGSSTPKQITVEVSLPNGADWLGSTGGITKNTTQHYQITLKPKQSINEVLTVRLPEQAGTHAIKIKISEGNKVINQLESRYLVRDIASRIKLLKQHIDPWRVVGTNGTLALGAKTQIGLIQTHLNTKVDELAVYEAANLATTLSKMQETPTHQSTMLRYEADELLKALQIKWYLSRNGNKPLP